MRLTVIPSDNTIIMNGRVLVFPFVAAANLHAIQWNDTFGFIETTDGKQVRTDSIVDVQSFIDAFITRAAVVDAPLPPPTIAQAKATKLASLEASRKRAIDTLPPVTVAGKQYHATPEYREVITGIALRQAAGRPVPGTLRGADGAPVTLTPVLIGQIDDAIAAAVEAQWTRYWSRYDAVNAPDATAASIAAVVW